MEKVISIPAGSKKVTVGIPVYNDSAHLPTCLDSVIGQTMNSGDIEVICVDDGSTDATPDIIRDYQSRGTQGPDILYLRHDNTGGPAKSRNRIIEQAAGEYTYFLDGDDYLGPKALQSMYDLGHPHDSDVVLGPFVGVNRGVPKHLFRETRAKVTLFDWNLIDSMNVLNMFRTDYVRGLGYRFNPDLRMAEDHPFKMNAYLHTDSVAVLSGVDCYYWVRHKQEASNRAHLTGGVLPVDKFYMYFHETFDVIMSANVEDERKRKAMGIYWMRLLSLDLLTEFRRKRTELDRELSFVHLRHIAGKYAGRDSMEQLPQADAFMMKLILHGNYELFSEYVALRSP